MNNRQKEPDPFGGGTLMAPSLHKAPVLTDLLRFSNHPHHVSRTAKVGIGLTRVLNSIVAGELREPLNNSITSVA